MGDREALKRDLPEESGIFIDGGLLVIMEAERSMSVSISHEKL
jgi:hypothetical protein